MRIVLTGHPTVENMIQAINEGRVYQFFTKPCNPAHLGVAIRKALEHKELVDKNRRLSFANIRHAKESADCRANVKVLQDHRRGGSRPSSGCLGAARTVGKRAYGD